MDVEHQFIEKYQLALQTAQKDNPKNGLCGFELEWNLLNAGFHPLNTVGSGPGMQSFVDYLREHYVSDWAREYSQLEVFHWMIEWATRPYYHPYGAVYEGRLLEATLANALYQAGENFDERLYYWHGNLLFPAEIGHHSIPGSWHLAKRRYLERCVDLYGQTLSTAGTHTNLSLPDPLFAWDFMHLPAVERGNQHLDDYKSEFYITATRLMRAFAALFISTSASTPLQATVVDGKPRIVLTEIDSIRNLTFPNPPTLDIPNLYRSYENYLNLSYDLVRRGVRFGNNNWTPVRARSFAEPVERLIAITSEELQDLYARGLYSVGEESSVQETARQIEIQNLMARINLPMARVEVRTDDGGHPLEVDNANLILKHLLLIRFYADRNFARAFRYDREDLERARRNEEGAARHGLRASIENPFTGKTQSMREFLSWTLDEVRPLGEALGFWKDLQPLVEMAAGAPNTAERLRAQLRQEINADGEVPLDALIGLAEAREAQVRREVEAIVEAYPKIDPEGGKIGEFVQRSREEIIWDFEAPIRFQKAPDTHLETVFTDKTSEILSLAQHLIRIPSVTACPDERLDEVQRAATFIYDYLRGHGVGVCYYNRSKYPAVLAGFPGQMLAPVMLSGHFDVVEAELGEEQFNPHVEGDYLRGRGAADMKTVVATYLVWLKDRFQQGPPYPPVNLLLIGNEENGETEPMGTPHVLQILKDESDDGKYAPQLLIAGERTGESGNEMWGEICIQNRGVMRFKVTAHGQRGHTGTAGGPVELSERLIAARAAIQEILGQHLTLQSPDGWKSQARFPFIQVGTPGVYNISAARGSLGVEVRPIPQDDLAAMEAALQAYCEKEGLHLQFLVRENGIACDPQNPHLLDLIAAVRDASDQEPRIGRKLPGTSARFAPGGQGVVWGQSGLGPHAKDERHYIPSILPYYRALTRFGERLIGANK